ncbi:MAG TPA: hypothetical protein VHY91_25800 [Pirellulales bacterium]|jgi:hypothetical protein|nr:hypothetical protein [Pirellulales bacterium]
MDAGTVTHTLMFVAQLAAAIVGLATAIASINGMVPDLAGVIGWMVSTVALMRLLAVRRPRPGDDARRPTPHAAGLRMLLAMVAVLCISIVVVVAVVLGPQVPKPLDGAAKIVFSVLVLVAAFATAACFAVTRR